jgi:transcriptional regulator with GAF, ATPase, and Fis domain
MAETTTSTPMTGEAPPVRVRLIRNLGTRVCASRPQSVILEGEALKIGRAGHTNGPLSLHDPECSRDHALLDYDDKADVWTLRDLGSRNGTFVNGAKIEETKLEQGAVIRVGKTVLLYVEAMVAHTDELNPPRSTRMVGHSVPLLKLQSEISLVAGHPVPVLVLGETGTGKEVVAEELHRRSGRSGSFVPLNCATVSAGLAESELFGHVAGAFTGAQKSSDGLFVAAQGGTLFLDEIGEMPLELQPKVLRALAKGEVRPVGGTATRTVDVRVIAATHRPLAELAAKGEFREDLLARLTGWTLRIPPLRERLDDVIPLAQSFLPTQSGGWAIAADAAEALLLHDWPYNVRELEQVMKAAVVRARGKTEIGLDQLPAEIAAPLVIRRPKGPRTAPETPLGLLVAREGVPTREDFCRALERLGGNIAKVAEFFGKDRQQIYRWAKRYEVDLSKYRDAEAE